MILKLKQKMISLWKTSYYVKDENDNEIFKVNPTGSMLTRFKILDKDKNILLRIKKRYWRFLPRFDILDKDGHLLAIVKKKMTFLKGKYEIKSMIQGDESQYQMVSSVVGWDFDLQRDGQTICSMGKKLFRLTDTYELDIKDEDEMLFCLAMGVIVDCVQHNNKRR